MKPASAKPPPALPPAPRVYPLPLPRALPRRHAPTYPLARKQRLPLPRDAGPFLLLLLALALGAMSWNYFSARRLVTFTLNDQVSQSWTLQHTVRGALQEAGITWNPEDIVQPGLDEALPADGKIVIRVAAPVTIAVDGNVLARRTQSPTIAGVLRENGILLKASDHVYLDGRRVDPGALLPRYSTSAGKLSMPSASLLPMRLTVERAMPITVNDNGLVSTVFTTDATLGDALRDAGVLVYLGDYVTPELANPATAGASVFIQRSRPASITVDSHVIKTRTRETTIGGLLAQEGVQLAGKDYTDPPPTSPVVDNVSVAVTRVREVFYTETEYLPFEVKWLPNPDMEIDTRATVQTGQKGAKNRLFKSVYENGKLISRGLEREWIAQPPQNQIINYGTKLVLRNFTLPDGSVVQYWRKLTLLATSYTAATSGKPPWHPEYGITYLGLKAGLGIVAVDPRVINLRAQVYVPGYGVALAGDTGGRIQGKRIDLGYPDGNIDFWYRWVDVYILTPVPPASQINYIISDYPQQRDLQR